MAQTNARMSASRKEQTSKRRVAAPTTPSSCNLGKGLPHRLTQFSTQAEAEEWVKETLEDLAQYCAKGSLCAVFDIDGTILHEDNGGGRPISNKMLYTFYTVCKKLSIPVYIITARPEGPEQRKWTVGQLAACGYPPGSYVSLSMMPVKEYNRVCRSGGTNPWNFSNYKHQERVRIIRSTNKHIILNVGDQWSDLMRVPPCAEHNHEIMMYKSVERLPNRGIYVGCLVEPISWLAVKLPHS